MKRGYASLVRPLIDEQGAFYGRAALMISEEDYGRRDFPFAFNSVGGVVTSHHRSTSLGSQRRMAGLRYIGVLASKTDDASRKSTNVDVPERVVSDWLREQVGLVDKTKHQVMTMIKLAHRISAWGGHPGDLPFCYSGGQIVSRAEVSHRIQKAGEAYILLVKNVVDSINWLSFEGISVALLTDRIKPQAVAATVGNSDAFGRELGQWLALRLPRSIDIAKIPAESVTQNPVLRVALDQLGPNCRATVGYVDVSDADLDIPAPQKMALIIKPSR